jgi:hypothetical protein
MFRQSSLVQEVAPQPCVDEQQETDQARLREGYVYKDQRNASMQCPKEGAHKTLVFRAKTGVNVGKLFWKCTACVGRDGKLGNIIGRDNELVPSGMRLVEEREMEAVAKAKRPREEPEIARRAEGALVASGKGIDWTGVAERVNEMAPLLREIQAQQAVLLARYDELARTVLAHNCARAAAAEAARAAAARRHDERGAAPEPDLCHDEARAPAGDSGV